MDWRRIPRDDPRDPDGVGALIRRAEAEVGGPPIGGVVLIDDAATMFAHTRSIEATVRGLGANLWVGFQSAEKLDMQEATYQDLVDSGTSVTAFGTGRPATRSGVRWCEVPDDPLRVENQWFLVARQPEPMAAVCFETSPEGIRASGPAGASSKTWRGFVTSDRRFVDALVAHLRGLAERMD